MRRTNIRMTAWLGATLVALSACAFAQDFTQKPKSPKPDELPGKQLIVWTETQKPHPLPATSPEMYQSTSQTQILTGTILARGSKLFLAGGGADYRLGNEQAARAFMGKPVRITGKKDQCAGVLYVLEIEQR
jgi:hypothetical protein